MIFLMYHVHKLLVPLVILCQVATMSGFDCLEVGNPFLVVALFG